MEVFAITKNIPMSAQKMREVVRQIQGLSALEAQAILAIVPRKGARYVAKRSQAHWQVRRILRTIGLMLNKDRKI